VPESFYDLFARYQRTGDRDALNEAITSLRTILATTPAGHADRGGHLQRLSVMLGALYDETRDRTVLAEAAQLGRAAAAAFPAVQVADMKDFHTVMLNIFQQSGAFDTSALTMRAEGDKLIIDHTNHPARAMCLSNLCRNLVELYRRTGDPAVLAEAVQVGRDSAAAIPAGHPQRVGCLTNLGAALRWMFEETDDLAILAEAVQAGRDSVAAVPADHPDRAAGLQNLGRTLVMQHHRTGDLAVLAEAVQVGRDSVAATPVDHPRRAVSLHLLGGALFALHHRTKERAALTEAQNALANGAASPTAPVMIRVGCGLGSSECAILAGEPTVALSAMEKVVELLPQFVSRALSRQDREHGLGELAGLASEVAAAAVAAGRPERAVELLEQTRGILLGEAIAARDDLTELRRAAPALADELDQLRSRTAVLEEEAFDPSSLVEKPALDVEAAVDAGWDSRRQRLAQLGEQRTQLADHWSRLSARIRAAGLEHLLRAPSISRLRHLAEAGPVVAVYASRHRADALILTTDASRPVQVVPLPDLTLRAANEQANRLIGARAAAYDDDPTARAAAQHEMQAVLGWMWDVITGPVLDHLGITGRNGRLPRIWWCPVGVLAYLPLHAAGHHAEAGRSSRRTVMDRAVSSYAITLRALEHARAHRKTAQVPAGSSVVVAMPATPGGADLPGVRDEADALAVLLDSPSILIGPDATHRSVAAALPRHRIAHFACHGLSDWSDPASSRLLLTDHEQDPLTVTALTRLHLAEADLAYLSACSTTDTSPRLVDEAVQLTAAVHLAGYRHVIGTLWPIEDEVASRIATDFYIRLTRNGRQQALVDDSVYVLAEVTRKLRDRFPRLPTRWAAHIHVGP